MPIFIVTPSPITAHRHGRRFRHAVPWRVALCILVACTFSADRAFLGVRFSMPQIAPKAKASVGLFAASRSDEQTPGKRALYEVAKPQQPDVSGAPGSSKRLLRNVIRQKLKLRQRVTDPGPQDLYQVAKPREPDVSRASGISTNELAKPQEPYVSGAGGISKTDGTKTLTSSTFLLRDFIQRQLRCNVAKGDIIYTDEGSQVTVQLPILTLEEPLEFTVKTPYETSRSDEGVQLAAAAALQALPSWFSTLHPDDFANLKQRKKKQLELIQSNDAKIQLQNVMQAALKTPVRLNFTKISKKAGPSVKVALRLQGLEKGEGAPLEFRGVGSTAKAAEQQAAQAALDKLRPTLVAMARSNKNQQHMDALKKDPMNEELNAFAEQIVAKLKAAGKSVDIELSGGRMFKLLPALARLPEELHASAQLLPTGVIDGTKQYLLRVTRDDPVEVGVVDTTNVVAATSPTKLAASLRKKLEALDEGASEQRVRTVEMIFTSAKAGVNAIKAIRILQGSFREDERSVKFMPRYTIQESNGAIDGATVHCMAVAMAMA